jgi:hypothetical protein
VDQLARRPGTILGEQERDQLRDVVRLAQPAGGLAAGECLPLLVASQSRDLGTPIGGLPARQFGITAPFWFGFFGSAVLVAELWREFDKIVHGSEVPVLA